MYSEDDKYDGSFTPFNLRDVLGKDADQPALLIFAGKSLEFFSDGKFKAPIHQVVAHPMNQNAHRRIHATFFTPDPAPTIVREAYKEVTDKAKEIGEKTKRLTTLEQKNKIIEQYPVEDELNEDRSEPPSFFCNKM